MPRHHYRNDLLFPLMLVLLFFANGASLRLIAQEKEKPEKIVMCMYIRYCLTDADAKAQEPVHKAWRLNTKQAAGGDKKQIMDAEKIFREKIAASQPKSLGKGSPFDIGFFVKSKTYPSGKVVKYDFNQKDIRLPMLYSLELEDVINYTSPEDPLNGEIAYDTFLYVGEVEILNLTFTDDLGLSWKYDFRMLSPKFEGYKKFVSACMTGCFPCD